MTCGDDLNSQARRMETPACGRLSAWHDHETRACEFRRINAQQQKIFERILPAVSSIKVASSNCGHSAIRAFSSERIAGRWLRNRCRAPGTIRRPCAANPARPGCTAEPSRFPAASRSSSNFYRGEALQVLSKLLWAELRIEWDRPRSMAARSSPSAIREALSMKLTLRLASPQKRRCFGDFADPPRFDPAARKKFRRTAKYRHAQAHMQNQPQLSSRFPIQA